MSKIQESKVFTNGADEAFQAGLRVFPALGYEIWKTRAFAWLIQARKPGEGIELNFSARPEGKGARVTLNLSGESATETELREEAGKALAALEGLDV